MAYITTTHLSQRLGATLYARLTDRVNGTTANAAVAQEIIDGAEAEADSYLARRYRTPIDLGARPELANVLAARVLDLAEFAAWKSSPFTSDPPQRVHLLYAAALEWFEAVAAGRIVLPAAAPPAGPAATQDAPQYAGGGRVFTAEELDGL
ncbi:MAG: phage protein Gp36 family protein [Planctomycetota bacterium]